jgi:hypothetical protein
VKLLPSISADPDFVQVSKQFNVTDLMENQTKKQIEDQQVNIFHFPDMCIVGSWSDRVIEKDYIREYRNEILM